MTTVLAIETSVSQATIALQLKGELHIRSFESHRQQNQLLFPPLEELLNLLHGENIDEILIGTGPGSYSGSRIAIAAAQGLAIVHQCKPVGVCSFFGIPKIPQGKKAIAVGDARRGSYFIHPLEGSNTTPQPKLYKLDDFNQEMSRLSKKEESYVFTFETQTEIPFEGITLVNPSAEGLIQYWNQLDPETQRQLSEQTLEPLYLRAPFITRSTKSHPLLKK